MAYLTGGTTMTSGAVRPDIFRFQFHLTEGDWHRILVLAVEILS
jgi:hypothetical protein